MPVLRKASPMRLAIAIVIGSIIALLCAYSGLRHPGISLDDCLANPEEYDGKIVCSPYEATIGRITEDGFMLRWDGKEIPVRGTSPDLKEGTYGQVKGIFHREGYIEAIAVGVGEYRWLKMATSLAATAIVLYLLCRGFRWDRAARAFREK